MARIEIRQGIGYTGKMGNRAYVAQILGTDEQYGLNRVFLEADDVTRDHFGRARYIRTYAYELGCGLYEISEQGDRRYIVVWPKDGEAVHTSITEERTQQMAQLMDSGMEIEDARIATKPQAAANA